MLGRRDALKLGFFGAGLLAVGGVGLSARSSRLRTPPRPLQALDPVEYAVLAAIADRCCLGDDPFPPAETLQVAAHVDELLAHAEPALAGDIKKLLRLFENAAANFVFGGRTQPFTQMSPADQDAVLAEWRDSRLTVRRTGFKALRGLVVAAYYANPATDAAVGYPGPPEVGPQGPLRQVEPGGGAR